MSARAIQEGRLTVLSGALAVSFFAMMWLAPTPAEAAPPTAVEARSRAPKRLLPHVRSTHQRLKEQGRQRRSALGELGKHPSFAPALKRGQRFMMRSNFSWAPSKEVLAITSTLGGNLWLVSGGLALGAKFGLAMGGVGYAASKTYDACDARAAGRNFARYHVLRNPKNLARRNAAGKYCLSTKSLEYFAGVLKSSTFSDPALGYSSTKRGSLRAKALVAGINGELSRRGLQGQ